MLPFTHSRSKPARALDTVTQSQDGIVLVSTLFALLLLATAAMLTFSVVVDEQRLQLRSRMQLDIRALNDALIAESLAEFSIDRDFPGFDHSSKESSTGGIAASTVTSLGLGRSSIVVVSSLGAQSLRTETIVSAGTEQPRVLSWRRLPSP